MPEKISDFLKQLDLKNSSGEIIGIIKDEIQTKTESSELVKDDLSVQLKDILQDEKAMNTFLNAHQIQFNRTFSSASLTNEIILKIDKTKLSSYVSDRLRQFCVSTGGKYVDELMTPVIGNTITSFSNTSVAEFINSADNLDNIKSLAISGLSYLVKQGIKVKEISENDLKNELQTLNQFLVGNFKEDILNKVTDEATDLIRNNVAIVLKAEGDLKQEFTQDFEDIRAKAENEFKKSFGALYENIQVLITNESNVQNVITQFKNDIAIRSTQIKTLEDNIATCLETKDFPKLATNQLSHAKAVAANLFQTNILNSYLKDGISFLNSINNYQNQAINILSDDTIYKNIKSFTDNLSALAVPTFSGIVTFATNGINNIENITSTLSKLNIFPGAAQSVGNYLKYAEAAIAVAAALLPPNPIGIIGAIGCIGGLFGSSGPSIEEMMFKEMQKDFQEVNKKLDNIQKSINDLAKEVEEAYKNIMQSLQLISNELYKIEEELHLIEELEGFEIFLYYNLLDNYVEKYNSYSNLGDKGLQLYKKVSNEQNFTKALSVFDAFIYSEKSLSKIAQQKFTENEQTKDEQTLDLYSDIENTTYQVSLSLFTKLFATTNASDRKKI